jgi:hypothetical protein
MIQSILGYFDFNRSQEVDMESIVPFMIWALFCFPVGYLTPNFIKDQTWQIILVVLLPIFGSFFIGASFYIIFESSGPSFKLFDFYGYFIYSMMFLYYGLLAGVPSSVTGYLFRITILRKRRNTQAY